MESEGAATNGSLRGSSPQESLEPTTIRPAARAIYLSTVGPLFGKKYAPAQKQGNPMDTTNGRPQGRNRKVRLDGWATSTIAAFFSGKSDDRFLICSPMPFSFALPHFGAPFSLYLRKDGFGGYKRSSFDWLVRTFFKFPIASFGVSLVGLQKHNRLRCLHAIRCRLAN